MQQTTRRRVIRILASMLKGGPGKSTLLWFLTNALAATFPDLRVVLICADIRTKTLRHWYASAVAKSCGGDPAQMPFLFHAWRGDDKDGPLSDFARKVEEADQADIVLIDTGGEQRDVFMSALLYCNVLLCPCGTSMLELVRMPETKAAAEAVGAYSAMEMFVVLVRVTHKGRGRARMAREWLNATEATDDNPVPCGLDVMQTEIKHAPLIYVDQFGILPKDLGDFPELVQELAEKIGL